MYNCYEDLIEELFKKNSAYNEKTKISLLNNSKIYLSNIRKKFEGSAVNCNYTSNEYKAIYLLAYYPFYTYPLNYILENHKVEIENTKKINVAFFGSGPAPELLGFLNYIHKKEISKIEVSFFDKNEKEWKNAREITINKLAPKYYDGEIITISKFCDFTKSYDTCINYFNCEKSVVESDFVIFQNFFNEINLTNEILEHLIFIFNNMKNKSKLIIVDLKYKETKDMMFDVEKIIEEKYNGKLIHKFNSEVKTMSLANIIPKIIEDNLFENKDYLYPKRKVEFHYSLIQKEGD